MGKKTEKPGVVIAAEKVLRRFHTIGVSLAVGLGSLTYLWSSYAIKAETNVLMWIAPTLIGWTAFLIYGDRRKKSDELIHANEVIRVYQQRQLEMNQREIEATLSAELGEETLPDSHPLHGIAARVRELGGDDARVSRMVDTLVANLDAVRQDVDALRDAIETEQSQSTSENQPRIDRWTQVLATKEAVLAQINAALQDLHAALTAQQHEDHEALFHQVNDLLARISAETEVAQAVTDGNADTDYKHQLQAIKAKQKQS